MPRTKEQIADRLNQVIAKQGITLVAAAERSGISHSSLRTFRASGHLSAGKCRQLDEWIDTVLVEDNATELAFQHASAQLRALADTLDKRALPYDYRFAALVEETEAISNRAKGFITERLQDTNGTIRK